MDNNVVSNKGKNWVNIIGFIILLLGIYGIARTSINLMAFDKYPFGGIFPSLPIGLVYQSQPYYQTETSCIYEQVYYAPDNITPREQTETEKRVAKSTETNCINGIKEQRDIAKINDISNSLLFFIIGIGVLGYKKILKIS